jgi:IS605 OrfB family transposase
MKRYRDSPPSSRSNRGTTPPDPRARIGSQGFPRFKSKKNPVQSFQVPQHYGGDFDQRKIRFPKIGEVKTVFHRVFTGKMKYATVSVTSTKTILRLARYHVKIANQRNDFLHKLSNRFVSENQAIAVESLNVGGMMKNHHPAQGIGDISWSMFFTMLEYTCRRYGKTLLKIGRFDPSSKICSRCGYLKQDLVLSDREWVCPDCGTHHDRDINAAIAIKKFALQEQNLVGVAGAGRTVEPVDSPR